MRAVLIDFFKSISFRSLSISFDVKGIFCITFPYHNYIITRTNTCVDEIHVQTRALYSTYVMSYFLYVILKEKLYGIQSKTLEVLLFYEKIKKSVYKWYLKKNQQDVEIERVKSERKHSLLSKVVADT